MWFFFYFFNFIRNTLFSVASSSADHIFYRGETSSTETELFRIKGGGGIKVPYAADAINVGGSSALGQIAISGTGSARYHLYNGGGVVEWIFGQNSSSSHDFTFSTVVSGVATTRATITQNGQFAASPRYGTRGKSSNQLIPNNTAAAITWNDMVIPSSQLSSNGVSWTNISGDTLVLYVSYNITWDVLFGGGVVGAYIESSTSLVYLSVQSTLFTSAYTSCSASGVIVLAAGASIACWANNLTGTNLSIIGAGNLVVNSCQMSCYILN